MVQPLDGKLCTDACISSKKAALTCMLCLSEHNNGSYCGNKIVEEGEECDCGRPEECDDEDRCCVARDDARGIPGCTVRPGRQCR